MAWTIRNVQIEDAKAITEILNPIIEAGTHTVLDTPFTVEEEKDFITNFTERGIFHVAVDSENKTLSGFQTVEPFASIWLSNCRTIRKLYESLRSCWTHWNLRWSLCQTKRCSFKSIPCYL